MNDIIMTAFEDEIRHTGYNLRMKREGDWEYADDRTQELFKLFKLFKWGWLSSPYHSNGGKYE